MTTSSLELWHTSTSKCASAPDRELPAWRVQDQVVRAVVQQCPMLLYLNLARTPIGDTAIWSIAKCVLPASACTPASRLPH